MILFLMMKVMDLYLLLCFSLNMLVNTQDGQSYSEKEIFNMFQQAGLKGAERLPFKGNNDSGIICAVV